MQNWSSAKNYTFRNSTVQRDVYKYHYIQTIRTFIYFWMYNTFHLCLIQNDHYVELVRPFYCCVIRDNDGRCIYLRLTQCAGLRRKASEYAVSSIRGVE